MDANHSTKPQTLMDLALAHVYPDAEDLIQDAAREFAVSNMGQSVERLARDQLRFMEGTFRQRPEILVRRCYSALYQSSESDDIAEGLEDERKTWLRDARKYVAQVQKKGLPLTLASVRLAHEGKGPFEARPRKK